MIRTKNFRNKKVICIKLRHLDLIKAVIVRPSRIQFTHLPIYRRAIFSFITSMLKKANNNVRKIIASDISIKNAVYEYK